MGVPRFMMGVWYGTLLVYMVMVHRWFLWYGTSLVSMEWYIVRF